MGKKRRWKVAVVMPEGLTVEFEEILSTSEKGARRQVRERFSKEGIGYTSITVEEILTELEKLKRDVIKRSGDFGDTIKALVYETCNEAQDLSELRSLLTDRLESLADQCYEMMDEASYLLQEEEN